MTKMYVWKFQLDASVISCALTLVIISTFLHINYLFKLLSMISTAVIHMLVYGCLLAKGLDHEEITSRYLLKKGGKANNKACQQHLTSLESCLWFPIIT